MKKKCSIHDCGRDVFQDQKECILHCEKHSYYIDYDNSGMLKYFYDALIEYIALNIAGDRYSRLDDSITMESLMIYLIGDKQNDLLANFLREETIVFNYIFFPDRDARDFYDYLKILKKTGKIYFNFCQFQVGILELKGIELFYQDCTFHQSWTLCNSNILKNINKVLYQGCIYKNDVNSIYKEDEMFVLENALFCDCKFEGSLSLRNIYLKKELFKNIFLDNFSIKNINIINCIFENNLFMNYLVSDRFVIKNSEFRSDVELKQCKIEVMRIHETKFLKTFNSYLSQYGEFLSIQNTFDDYAGFEGCKFSFSRGVPKPEKEVVFQFTSFLSFTNFRNTISYGDFNLENVNLKESPNFLNIQLKSDNTNRETLRIIKDSFDKSGNHIEANKFFVLEMAKYKQELFSAESKWENLPDKVIYWFNEKASNFGQSYLLPILWIIIWTSMYSFLVSLHKKGILNLKVPFFDGVSQYMIPFKIALEDGMETVSVIFYVILSTLIWQTIVAVKRYTKR